MIRLSRQAAALIYAHMVADGKSLTRGDMRSLIKQAGIGASAFPNAFDILKRNCA